MGKAYNYLLKTAKDKTNSYIPFHNYIFPKFKWGDMIDMNKIRPLSYEYYNNRSGKYNTAQAHKDSEHDHKLAMKRRWEAGSQQEPFDKNKHYYTNIDKNVDTGYTEPDDSVFIRNSSLVEREHAYPYIDIAAINSNSTPEVVLEELLHNYAPMTLAGKNVKFFSPQFWTLNNTYSATPDNLVMKAIPFPTSKLVDYTTYGNGGYEAPTRMVQAKGYMRANGYTTDKYPELKFDDFLNMPEDMAKKLPYEAGREFIRLNNIYKSNLKFFEDGFKKELHNKGSYVKKYYERLLRHYNQWKRNASDIWLQSNNRKSAGNIQHA